jgi:UDP-N-acetyl-D-glucosamine dehydrogenase
MTQRLAVMGQGYVGLPLAVRAVENGYDVIAFDPDVNRIAQLDKGESFIEDVPDERLRSAKLTGRYRATTDVADCAGFDVAVITVPTPLRDGLPDVSFIREAAMALAPHVRAGTCVILESTTYPGTTTEVVAPLLEAGSRLVAGEDFHLGYSPERIDPGNTVWTFERTPKLVSGINPESRDVVKAFYDTIVEHTVVVAGTAEAELAKLIENTFRHVNIALVNELAMLAHELRIDIWEAIRAAATKPFGFMPFLPGPGVGGHCIPIDPSYLSWQVRHRLGHDFRFVELANDINNHMPNYVVNRLILALNERGRALRGSRVLVLGLAYKRNSSDARQTPAVPLVRQLLDLGAEVWLADPSSEESPFDGRVVRVSGSADEARAADGVILVTDHDSFDLEGIAAAAGYLLDTRHRVSGPHVEYL